MLQHRQRRTTAVQQDCTGGTEQYSDLPFQTYLQGSYMPGMPCIGWRPVPLGQLSLVLFSLAGMSSLLHAKIAMCRAHRPQYSVHWRHDVLNTAVLTVRALPASRTVVQSALRTHVVRLGIKADLVGEAQVGEVPSPIIPTARAVP